MADKRDLQPDQKPDHDNPTVALLRFFVWSYPTEDFEAGSATDFLLKINRNWRI
jgi:hypothetical protein